MRKQTDRRLAAVEDTVNTVAQARREWRRSREFWTFLKKLSDETGHDLLGGAFPRGYDPDAAPRRPPTVRDRMNAILAEAEAFIEGGQTAVSEAAAAS